MAFHMSLPMLVVAAPLAGSRLNIVVFVTADNSFDIVGRYGGGAHISHLRLLYDQAVQMSGSSGHMEKISKRKGG